MNLGGVKDNGRRIVGSNARFSASNHKNNFPRITLLIEVRSLNYSLSIVYCEPISSSFLPVHLSISPHSTYLIFIFSPLPPEYTTSMKQNTVCAQYNIVKYKTVDGFMNYVS